VRSTYTSDVVPDRNAQLVFMYRASLRNDWRPTRAWLGYRVVLPWSRGRTTILDSILATDQTSDINCSTKIAVRQNVQGSVVRSICAENPARISIAKTARGSRLRSLFRSCAVLLLFSYCGPCGTMKEYRVICYIICAYMNNKGKHQDGRPDVPPKTESRRLRL